MIHTTDTTNNGDPLPPIKDKIVERVVRSFSQRSHLGMEKYGTTMERDDLSFYQWIQHVQEELMDATVYLEKIKDEMRTITVFHKPPQPTHIDFLLLSIVVGSSFIAGAIISQFVYIRL